MKIKNIATKSYLLHILPIIALIALLVSIAFITILNVVGGGLLGSNNPNTVKADPTSTNTTPSLSISISNGTNQASTNNTPNSNGNINLNLPRTGGTISGTHDLTINTTNTYNGYNLTLTTNSNNNKLTNTTNSNQTINPTTNTKSNPSTLQNNTWGYNISNRNNITNYNPTTYKQVLPKNTTNNTDKQIANIDINTTNYNPNSNTDKYRVAYAIRVDNPTTLTSGTYTNTVIYTLTANPVPAPTITTISPRTFSTDTRNLTSNPKLTIIGNNLLSTNKVQLTLNGATKLCNNLTVISNTKVTCNIDSIVNIGQYNVSMTTAGGTINKTNAIELSRTCLASNSSSTVQVDIDANMIPIRYVGNQNNTNSGWVKANSTNTNYNWYNYNNKRWANAVTVTNPAKYKNATEGTPIENSDIKGYWVYIPRYDYCVKRFNASDPVLQAENFDIRFKRATDQKHIPTGNNTWATHPAFTWGDQELNGLWVAKFELTGPRTAPTVLPNKVSNAQEEIGSFYNIIKSIGVEDPDNVGGGCLKTHGCLSTITKYNQHNLNTSSSHMLKNSEWGAIAYLSASQYGAGVNKVQINAARPNTNDNDGSYSYGTTGCGPQADGNENSYNAPKTNGACGNTDRQYAGSLGQLASTTNNIYGVYDMSGGLEEYVMYNYNNVQGGHSSYMTTMPTGKYINIYPQNIFTNNDLYTNYSQCAWQYCGSHALHETLTVQEVSSDSQSWGGDSSRFVRSSYPWAVRGGNSSNGSHAGVFSSYSIYYGGYGYDTIGARAALVVLSK